MCFQVDHRAPPPVYLGDTDRRPNILKIDKITVWYESVFGDIHALDRLSLDIEGGGIVCLLGINGAGKTTLLKTISGVIKDYDGRITNGSMVFEGREIRGLHPSRIVSLGISHAPQGRHIFHTLSVKDNLLLGAYLKRHGRGANNSINKRMKDLFDLFPILLERRRQKSGTLSGGEQQMLSIGRALMLNPKLLLLDEPFLGLAPMVIKDILRSLTGLKGDGLTLFLAEQNARAVLPVSDRCYIMDKGYIIAEGEPEEILKTNYIRDIYFGEER